MKILLKKGFICFLAVVIFSSNFLGALHVLAASKPIFNDSTASKWAIAELTQAYNYGLTYPDIMGKFQQPITREEFCVIVVKLYTKLTNKTVTASGSPFSDTNNPEIIKAYQLGIVNGTGGGKFSPTLSITRQEIATMIYRALSKAYSNLPKIDESKFPFRDADKIASWALTAMKFAYQNGIMKGVSQDKIDPLSNTTREQGIILVKRTYENFRTSINAKLRLLSPPPQMSEEEKLKKLDLKANLAAPTYNTKLTLYAATDATKPVSKPTDKISVMTGSLYTRADDGAFIESSGNKVRYFYADYGTLTPYAIVWQVSRAPFTGFQDNWKNPRGLVSTGTITPAVKEFTIDFSKFTTNPIIPINQIIPKTESEQTFYVRAVPVDKNMNCIGDPGEGIRVLYGQKTPGLQKQIAVTVNGKQILKPSTFELWVTRGDGDITCSGEFPNKLEHISEVGFNTLGTVKWFQFKNFPKDTKTIILQISVKPFDTKDPIDKPSGLVYSKAYTPPIPPQFCPSTENSVAVKFHDFAPDDSTMKPGDYIPYYVRAVAFSPSSTPGSNDYSLSDVVKVNYMKQNTVILYQFKNVAVPTYIPSVKITHYEPIKWQDPNWAHYYVVYRYPKWNELNFEVTNGKDTLYPYYYYFNKDLSMTPERYENEILWKWLPPGTKIQVWDREQDKSWYEELWDDIVNFFKSIANVIMQITNWVSQAYANLKSGLINFVVNNLPGIPSEWRDNLKNALAALVDYGLASLGIPPTLPNFDQLTEQGLDYLAKEALTEAGVPADQMTADLVATTAQGIAENLASSTNSATPNPINAPFLKADPDYLARPAYIDIKITNDYNKPSVPGKLNVDVSWEWHEWNPDGGSITLSTEVFGDQSASAQFADALEYFDHFVFGLKRGCDYQPIYYPVFEPMRDISIPILQPHESTTVRIYLKEYVGKPYPFAPNGDIVTWDDFTNLYGMEGSVGPCQFSVYANGFDLPIIPKKTYYDPSTHTIYTYNYDRTYSSDSFQGVPKNPFSK
jgi:hypothetical protein